MAQRPKGYGMTAELNKKVRNILFIQMQTVYIICVTVTNIFTNVVRLCYFIKYVFNVHSLWYKDEEQISESNPRTFCLIFSC